MEMELLRQHGLYGGGLIDVDNPLLVGRYNECLAEIGERPTSLNRFQIDGRGWSPEVAQEKKNRAYLSHGGAIQYAILLTPDQVGKPIHSPYFSFERAVMAFLFRQAGDAIAGITKSTGLWIEINPGLSEFNELSDLTMVRSINVTLGDPKQLVREAENQQQLVGKFLGDKDAWTDEKLRSELTASGQKFGDLRFAPSFKSSYQYTDTECFYTTQFGGAFVLRQNADGHCLLVIGDEDLAAKKDIGCKVCSFTSRKLLLRLVNMGLLEVPVYWYRENLKVLGELREGMLVCALYENGNSKIDFTKLNRAQKEKCVMDNRKNLPPEFALLERLEQRLRNGDSIDSQHLPLTLKWLLARPVDGLPIYVAQAVWKLICRIAQVRLVRQFVYDKEMFFSAFGSWPEARQRWALETILQSGLAPGRHV